jgi:hypothetical protein
MKIGNDRFKSIKYNFESKYQNKRPITRNYTDVYRLINFDSTRKENKIMKQKRLVWVYETRLN